MFGHIRRHQKWLWAVIATLTIVSFVVFLDPTTGRRGGGRSIFGRSPADYGTINGREITAEEFERAKTEARLEFRIQTGRWPEDDEASRQFFDPNRRALERLFLIQKISDLNIQVGEAAVADWIARAFRDPKTGALNEGDYQRFLKAMLTSGRARVSENDLLNFLRHQVGRTQLSALVGLSGSLVTPREAETAYRQENEQLLAEAVFFPSSNYLAGVQVTPEALAQFYTNNMALYRIPERVQVSYVKFLATNFLAEADQQLAQVTNLTQRLDGLYQQRGADFYKDADGKPLPHDAAIQKIKEQQRQLLSLSVARKKAGEFMEQLDELNRKQPNQLDNLEKLAAATGLQSAATEPFTRRDGPRDLNAPAPETFAKVAFELSSEEPMASEPIVGEDAVYVIAFRKKIPSEMPSLDSLRDNVTAEFRQREATELARKAGLAFYGTLTNGLAQNKSFQAICLEASQLSQKLPAFSLNTSQLPDEWQGRVDVNLLKDVVSSLAPGNTSRFQTTRDGGLIVHLLSRQPVDEAKLKAELPDFTERLRAERRQEAANAWFRKEFELAHVSGPPEKKSAAQ